MHLSVQGDSRGIFCGDSIWGLKGDFAGVSSLPKPLFYRDSIWGLDGDLGFLKTLNPKHPKPSTLNTLNPLGKDSAGVLKLDHKFFSPGFRMRTGCGLNPGIWSVYVGA